jgi:hypothetical protein
MGMVYPDQADATHAVSYWANKLYNRGDTSRISFPYICIDFNNGVATGTTFPVKFYASVWMEAVLIQPTPIFSEKSPVDVNFNKVRAIMSDIDKFPIATKGHSFKNLEQQAAAFAEATMGAAIEMAPTVTSLFKAGNTIVKGVRKARRGRRKRRAKKRNTMRKSPPPYSAYGQIGIKRLGANLRKGTTPNVSTYRPRGKRRPPMRARRTRRIRRRRRR